MALLLMPNGLENINHYYIRFDFSIYAALHVDCGKRTVEVVSIKDIGNTPVFVRPFDPYKLHEARVYDSSSFRMVLCFFDRFYVTIETMQVSEFATPADYMREMRVSLYHPRVFSPFAEGRDANPWRTIKRDGGAVWVCEFSPTEDGLDPGPGSTTHCSTCKVKPEIDGSLTLWPTSGIPAEGQWGANNFSTDEWRLTDARKPHSGQPAA